MLQLRRYTLLQTMRYKYTNGHDESLLYKFHYYPPTPPLFYPLGVTSKHSSRETGVVGLGVLKGRGMELVLALLWDKVSAGVLTPDAAASTRGEGKGENALPVECGNAVASEDNGAVTSEGISEGTAATSADGTEVSDGKDRADLKGLPP